VRSIHIKLSAAALALTLGGTVATLQPAGPAVADSSPSCSVAGYTNCSVCAVDTSPTSTCKQPDDGGVNEDWILWAIAGIVFLFIRS
jgi:hypothetical protein